jgi:hypothetical protein
VRASREVEAWREYLETTRSASGGGDYFMVEPWAWLRLLRRLELVAGAFVPHSLIR